MKENLKTLALVFSVALNVTLIAIQAAPYFRGESRFVFQELELSPKQRARFEAGQKDFVASINQRGNQMIARLSELMDLLAADPVVEEAVQAKLDELNEHHRSMQRAMVRHLMKDREILAGEQRREYFSILKERLHAQGAPGPVWVPRGARRRE
ncbi:MAG: periplasmic heavy metal sensor [Bryobacteraceae bacterium]|nr:periplasmic heavy metal sensor [Bryobacteraceae bacterium]